MKSILFLALIITITGCTRAGDFPVSSNCVWSEEDNRSLNLGNAADRRHLRDDAVTVEDVAIRWADKHFARLPEYGRRRNECMDSMFNQLATHHRVEVDIARQYRLERDIVFDSAGFLIFGVVYTVVAYYVAGRIRRRFPPGESGFWIMTITMSVCAALVGVVVGNLWAIVLETVRLNSGHLSYRMSRIPWRQHWAVLYICGFVIFVITAAIRSRVGLQVKGGPALHNFLTLRDSK